MELLLIRHGQAGKPSPAIYPNDDERPLTAKGERAFKSAALGLHHLKLDLKTILTSPTVRTRKTTELLALGLELSPKVIRVVPQLHFGFSPIKALSALGRMKLRSRVAIVGHEPWLGDFLTLLIAPKGPIAFKWTKGGACLVETPEVGRGNGRLLWFLTQDQLGMLK